jgi:O-antigen/teichoic acid export membrane protein
MPDDGRPREAALYLLPVVVGNLIPFFTLPLFTRALSASDYGLIALAQAFATAAGGLANFGLNTVYDRNFFKHRDPPKAAALLYSCAGFVAAAMLLAGAATALFRRQVSIALFGSAAFGGLALWALASTATLKVETFFYSRLRNSGCAAEFALFTIAESCLDALLGVGLVFVLRSGPSGLLIGPFLSGLAVTLFMASRALRRLPFAWDRAVFLEALALAAPLVPLTFAGILSTQVDKVLIGRLKSLEGAGLYGIAQRIAMVGFGYMTALSNVYFPRIYRMMFDRDIAGAGEIGRYLTPYFAASLAGPLLIALFADELLRLLTPPPFHPAADLASILCLYYGIQFFGKTPQMMFRGRTGLVSMTGFLNLPLTLAFGLPLILLWGARGAALGLAAAGAAQMGIVFALSQRCYPIGWEYRKILPLLAYFFAAVGLVFPLRAWLPPAFAFACKLGLAAGFGMLAYRLGALPSGPVFREIPGLRKRLLGKICRAP